MSDVQRLTPELLAEIKNDALEGHRGNDTAQCRILLAAYDALAHQLEEAWHSVLYWMDERNMWKGEAERHKQQADRVEPLLQDCKELERQLADLRVAYHNMEHLHDQALVQYQSQMNQLAEARLAVCEKNLFGGQELVDQLRERLAEVVAALERIKQCIEVDRQEDILNIVEAALAAGRP